MILNLDNNKFEVENWSIEAFKIVGYVGDIDFSNFGDDYKYKNYNIFNQPRNFGLIGRIRFDLESDVLTGTSERFLIYDDEFRKYLNSVNSNHNPNDDILLYVLELRILEARSKHFDELGESIRRMYNNSELNNCNQLTINTKTNDQIRKEVIDAWERYKP